MLAQYRRYLFHFLSRDNPAGGILRRIENKQFGLVGNFGFEFFRVKVKAARLVQVDRHRHRPHGSDLRFVNGETGVGINHFIASAIVGYRQNGIGNKRFGASRYHHIICIHVNAASFANVFGHRLA